MSVATSSSHGRAMLSSGTAPFGDCRRVLCVSGSWKIRFIEPTGEMGTGDLCWVSPAALRHELARQGSGTGPGGDCSRVLWVPGPRGQYSGKIRCIEKPGVQDWRGV